MILLLMRRLNKEEINMKHVLFALLLLFTATVRIPMKGTVVIKNIVEVSGAPLHYYYTVTLTDGRKMYLPILWTIIEEDKDE